MTEAIKLFAYHNGNNGVSLYRSWQPLKFLRLDPAFHVKQLPHRSERVHFDGLHGECNVPGIGSQAEIIEQHDVIHTNFKATEEDCARLSITAKLKKLVVDLDDDILHIPSDNPNHKFWFNEENGKDYWAEIPADELGDPKWEALARSRGGRLMVHPETGKLNIVVVRRHPHEMVIDELKAAHLVTVSTERMRDIYKQYNVNTVIIPNAVDFSNFPAIEEQKKDGLIRMGLFGSNTHYRDWKTIAKVLKTLLGEFPNLRLSYNTWFKSKGTLGSSMDEQEKILVFPDYFENMGLVDHPQIEAWSPVEIEDYFPWLVDKGVDIGLAPLCDSEFNRAKSNLKYLEFSALRIPGVYQDMEPYNKDVKGGYNGFLAHDSSQWLKCLRKLITDAALRQNMGQAAYKDVKTRYNAEDVSKRLGNEIKKIMGVSYDAVPDYSASSGRLVLAR